MPARPPAAPLATLDHLVVAAATLADGIDWVAAATGATPLPGGKHVAMGTHNALLRLSNDTYLEIIAIDPDGVKPSRRRWFDLDDIALQAELTEQPRLIHWVARTDDIEAAVAASPLPLGTHPFDAARRLPLADHDPRRRRAPGARPRADADPVGRAGAPDRTPAEVERHAGAARRHPLRSPAPLRATLAALGLEGTIAISYDRETRIAAMLRTPKGIVTF